MSIQEVYLRTPSSLGGEAYDPIWAENVPQQRFHASAAKYRLLRGGAGSGKTCAGIMECVLTMIECPGTIGCIGRWNYPQLERTTWRFFVEVCQQAGLVQESSRKPGATYVKFHNGSLCWAVNLQDPSTVTSLTLGFYFVDELTEIRDPAIFQELHLRLRHIAGPRRGWYTGYSGGRDWLQELFNQNEHTGDYEYIKIAAKDNLKCLPPGYVEKLTRDMPPQWVQKFLDGDVDMYEGLVLPDFRPAIHVIPWFRPPDHWPRFRGLDHGWDHPTACVWSTVDEVGTLFVYDEFVKNRAAISQNVIEILEKTGHDHIEWTVADPATKQHQGQTGKSHIDEYRDCGLVPIFGGNNRIMDSVARLEQLLWVDPERTRPLEVLQRVGGKSLEGSPRLFIMDNCKQLISEIQNWKFAPGKIGGVFKPTPVNKYDDCIACLRYTAMQNPRAAVSFLGSSEYQRMVSRMLQLANDLHDEDEFDSDFLYAAERRSLSH